MRDDDQSVGGGVLLVEERLAIEDVDRYPVDRDADLLQGGLLGEEFVHVRS